MEQFSVLNLRRLDGGRRDGGFGEVYLGERSDTGVTVIVKYLVEGGIFEYREQFAREVRVLAAAVHPGVVRVLGWNLADPRPFYVMPYIRGGALSKHAGNLSNRDVLAWGAQIATALAAMHAQELIHGDVKPDNVLMDGAELRVSDPLGNGAGCTISFGTKWGGTPGYMSPELLDGWPISKEADVFAFGATLFHLATGTHPDGHVLDAKYHRANVDIELHNIILACAAPQPWMRPTMAQVHQRLVARWSAMPKPQVRVAPPPPPNPIAALIGVAAVALLGVGIASVLSGK